jgi:formate dehydrogenase maturation protein FdhE
VCKIPVVSIARPRVPATRSEPRDIVELKRLRIDHPELADAVNLQLELIELQRRVQARVPLPASLGDAEQRARLAGGRPLVRFSDLPLEWSDLRLTLRATADLLLRFGLMDLADHQALLKLTRDGHHLEPLVRRWFAASLERRAPGPGAPGNAEGEPARPSPLDEDASRFDDVLSLAVKPFLSRCAEAWLARTDLTGWQRGYCPLCAAEPDFAVLRIDGRRDLVCSRCGGMWPSSPQACPFCHNDDRLHLASFASRDGPYRLTACDVCLRYVKAFDERIADRPVLVSVDSIATLPLDASAVQRGYRG